MASQTNFYTLGYQAPPSPSSPPRRVWWLRPIVTLPAASDRALTCKETGILCSPCCASLVTVVAIFLILNFLDSAHSHAKFAIHSINVSPSSATWHVGFLMRNPNSRYSVYYDRDDVSVGLGPLNAAVLNMTYQRESRDLTAFTLDFVAEEERSGVVSEQVLDVKLRGKHKLYVFYDYVGHFDIRCSNLTRSHENIDKIVCQSSFTTSYMSI